VRRHLAAVMFTDLVGYTSTIHQDEEAGRIVRHRHRSAVEGALGSHGGTLLQYFGDGSLSVFHSAVEAVRAAREVQGVFRESPQGSLRIGIDLGDIAYDEQGAYGDAVNVASRLESLSEPGGVLISGKVQRELANHPEFEVVPLGEIPLRHVEAPVSIFALEGHGLARPSSAAGVDERFSAARRGAGIRPVGAVATALWERIRTSTHQSSRSRPEEVCVLGRLPLVGRADDLKVLLSMAERVEGGVGGALLLTGDRGIGKTRLARQLLEDLIGKGWLAARGQAFSTELGVPFGPFADAFGPLLREIEPAEIQLLSQGGAQDLAALWPPLARGGQPNGNGGDGAGDARSRLFWTFSHFLGTLTRDRPLLLVLEDLQWADESSLDLFHFLARQISDKKVLLLCLFCRAEVETGSRLAEICEALERTRLARGIRLRALSPEATVELVTDVFQISSRVVEPFAGRLHRWTQGNPFFLEGILQALVETGQLRKSHGRWLGWEVQELTLPSSIRDAISMRVRRLSPDARRIADLVAVIGGQVSHEVLQAVDGAAEETLASSIAELGERQVLAEAEVDGDVVYRFSHPLIPETLEAELPRAVTRGLHARVAEALETHFGESAGEHVDELAYHFARAYGKAHREKALSYLAAAGRRALERNAHKEAAQYLEAALRHYGDLTVGEARGSDSPSTVDLPDLLGALAQARVNLGDQGGAIALWEEALPLVEGRDDQEGAASLLRRIGQAQLSQGRLGAALKTFEMGRRAAASAGEQVGEARLRLVEGVSLQQAGRPDEARLAIEQARETAERSGDQRLLASVRRALLLVHLWNGELELVRERGRELRAMVAEIGDPQLMFWSEWTLAAAAGLRGNTEELLRRVEELERIADRVRSPSLGLWAAELSLEYAYASGAWDVGLGIGEQAAALGRALNERTILPRILVCLSFIYVGRGELERAADLVDEAWAISGADGVETGVEFLNVHTVVPAHIGKTSHLMAREDWDGAIRVALAGLEVADRTGYVIWGIHRLLPLLGEAYFQAGRTAEGEEIAQRLRTCGNDLDHDLARAWGTAGEAIVAWHRGDSAKAARLLPPAAELLERIPMVYDAARLRRQLAGRLWEIGDGEGARRELRRVQTVFESLGATRELRKALIQMEEVGG
jgi:class 3 adenylate cyclase/tetratricopeptide (TPR) repeat protein